MNNFSGWFTSLEITFYPDGERLYAGRLPLTAELTLRLDQSIENSS